MTDLSIIIVNYKTPDLTRRCIVSILDTIKISIKYEIIIIDNESREATLSDLPNGNDNIHLISLKENMGFGRANNIGISKSNGKYLLFVNSDIVVHDNTIDECFRQVEKDPEIGVLGCKLAYADGSVQKSVYYDAGSFKSILVNNLFINYCWGYQEKKLNAIMGSFMLIPRVVIEKTGGFDPDFFMYSEEIELCRRITKQGYKIHFSENVSALHLHEGSSVNKKKTLRQRFLSNALLYIKLHGVFGYFLYHLLFFFNIIANFPVMWFVNKNYRIEYRQEYFEVAYGYFSNFFVYLTIPFLYSKKRGKGLRILKSS